MLTVNPKLTQKQVGDLINSTAAGLGEYHFDYAGEFHRPNLPYTTRLFENPLDKYYKRKVEWHEEVGYGLVDADRAFVPCWPSTPNRLRLRRSSHEATDESTAPGFILGAVMSIW